MGASETLVESLWTIWIYFVSDLERRHRWHLMNGWGVLSMARPKKLTLDFFVHRADISNDRRIKLLARKFGNDGYATYFRLLELICQEDGMLLPIKDPEVAELLAGDFSLRDQQHLYTIVQYCVEIHLFDKQLWESERSVFSIDLFSDYQERLETRKATADRTQKYRESKTLQERIDLLDQKTRIVTHHNEDVARHNSDVTHQNQVVTLPSRGCDTPEKEIRIQNSEDQKTKEEKESDKDLSRSEDIDARGRAHTRVREGIPTPDSVVEVVPEGGRSQNLKSAEGDASTHTSGQDQKLRSGSAHFFQQAPDFAAEKPPEIASTCNPSSELSTPVKSEISSAKKPSKLDEMFERFRGTYNSTKAAPWQRKKTPFRPDQKKAIQKIMKENGLDADQFNQSLANANHFCTQDKWWGASDKTNMGFDHLLRDNRIMKFSEAFEALVEVNPNLTIVPGAASDSREARIQRFYEEMKRLGAA